MAINASNIVCGIGLVSIVVSVACGSFEIACVCEDRKISDVAALAENF